MVVLIVDDDPDDIEVFCDALADVDPTIICVRSSGGQWAIDIMNAGAVPDIIVLDINMPKLSGKQTLIEVRKNPAFEHVKIYMFSTTLNSKEIEECKVLGATAFFAKPNTFQDMKSVVARMIKG